MEIHLDNQTTEQSNQTATFGDVSKTKLQRQFIEIIHDDVHVLLPGVLRNAHGRRQGEGRVEEVDHPEAGPPGQLLVDSVGVRCHQ